MTLSGALLPPEDLCLSLASTSVQQCQSAGGLSGCQVTPVSQRKQIKGADQTSLWKGRFQTDMFEVWKQNFTGSHVQNLLFNFFFLLYKCRTEVTEKVPGDIPCLCSSCSLCGQTTVWLDWDIAQQRLSQAIVSLQVGVRSGHPKATHRETSRAPSFWYWRHYCLDFSREELLSQLSRGMMMVLVLRQCHRNSDPGCSSLGLWTPKYRLRIS